MSFKSFKVNPQLFSLATDVDAIHLILADMTVIGNMGKWEN